HGDRRPVLVNMYGITETTVHVTFRPLGRDDLERGSIIGVPIPDLYVHILDAEREPVPLGVPGEIHVGGARLARGHLDRPAVSPPKASGPIHSPPGPAPGSPPRATSPAAARTASWSTSAAPTSRSRSAVSASSPGRSRRRSPAIRRCARRSCSPATARRGGAW